MRLVSATLACLLSVTAVCLGQADTPRLRNVSVGFTAQYRNRFWTPLVVDIENPGEERTVVVVAEGLAQYSRQVVQFSRPVWLPAHSSRLVEFSFRPDTREESEPSGIRVQKLLVVKLTDGKLHVWDKLDLLGSPVPEDAFFVLVSDSRYSSYNFLKQGVIGAAKRPLARVVAAPRNLPRRPVDYRGFDALVLGDLTGMDLCPLQVQAIYDWVRGGGLLIVVPGPTPLDNPLKALLPVSYFSRQLVETWPALAGTFHFNNGLESARMILRDGVVCRGSRDRPLVAVRREGLGTVAALAFDAGSESFAAWPGAGDFWRALFGETPQFFRYADQILQRSSAVEGVLSGLAGIKVPSRGVVLAYLLAVAGGLLAILFGFRLTRYPEWGWALAGALALVGGGLAIVMAARWKAQPHPFLNELAVTTTRSGSDTATIQAALGLFSPTETTYALMTADDTVSIEGGRSVLTPPEQVHIEYEDRLAVPDLRVRADDIRLLFGRGQLAAAPGNGSVAGGGGAAAQPPARFPRAEVRVDGEGLHLILANPTAHPLEDCFVKYHRFVLPIGDLAPGAVWDRAGLREPASTYTSRLVRSGQDELRSRLRGVFFPDPVFDLQRTISFEERRFAVRFRGEEHGPGLFGWTDQPQFPVSRVEPAVARRAVGLWAVEAPVVFEGKRFLLPRGVLSLRLKNKAAAANERGEGRFAGTRPTVLLLEFGLPEGCPPLAITEATLTLNFRGGPFHSDVLMGPADRAVTDDADLRHFELVAGGPVYRIPEPARFFNPATRSLVVALRIAAVPPGGRGGEEAMLGLNQWQVRECDLELTGTGQ